MNEESPLSSPSRDFLEEMWQWEKELEDQRPHQNSLPAITSIFDTPVPPNPQNSFANSLTNCVTNFFANSVTNRNNEQQQCAVAVVPTPSAPMPSATTPSRPVPSKPDPYSPPLILPPLGFGDTLQLDYDVTSEF